MLTLVDDVVKVVANVLEGRTTVGTKEARSTLESIPSDLSNASTASSRARLAPSF